jgi:hypothetical protein
MDIVIGATASVKMPKPKDAVHGKDMIEARILNVRPPRKKRIRRSADSTERRKNNSVDPLGSRVMVLLVPEGRRLPKDIELGKYKILMRFVPVKSSVVHDR